MKFVPLKMNLYNSISIVDNNKHICTFSVRTMCRIITFRFLVMFYFNIRTLVATKKKNGLHLIKQTLVFRFNPTAQLSPNWFAEMLAITAFVQCVVVVVVVHVEMSNYFVFVTVFGQSLFSPSFWRWLVCTTTCKL